MIISPLVKDMTSSNEILKSAAMKLLAKTITSENFALIDRYFRPFILSSSVRIQKAGLISGILLYQKAPEYIKKWSTDLQECLKLEDSQVTYLALSLISMTKSTDPLMMSRVIQELLKKGVDYTEYIEKRVYERNVAIITVQSRTRNKKVADFWKD